MYETELKNKILHAFKNNLFLKEMPKRSGKHIVTLSSDAGCLLVKKFDFSYIPVEGREPLIPLKALYEHEANVVRELYEYNQQYVLSFEDVDHGYLATKFIDGISVNKYLSKYPERAEQIFFECLECMQSLHKFGFLHGDLQPAHFMIDESESIHLIDFGLAGKLPNGYEHYPGQLVYFAAPEVCQGMLDENAGLEYSQKSELYSFGATMVYSLTKAFATHFPKGAKDTSFNELKRTIMECGADNYFNNLYLHIPENINQLLRQLLQINKEDRNL